MFTYTIIEVLWVYIILGWEGLLRGMTYGRDYEDLQQYMLREQTPLKLSSAS